MGTIIRGLCPENESRNPEVTDTMINMRLATTMCSYMYNGAETNNVNQIMRGWGRVSFFSNINCLQVAGLCNIQNKIVVTLCIMRVICNHDTAKPKVRAGSHCMYVCS